MPSRAKGADGKFAIYTVPTPTSADDAPLTDPFGNLGRMMFHTDLDYPAIDTEWSGVVTLPVQTQNTMVRDDHILFAHGKTSAPLVFGRITNFMSSDKTIVGLLPMQPDNVSGGSASFGLNSFKRWLGLAVDDTYVYLREYGPVKGASSGYPGVGTNWPTVTLNVVVYVTNFLLDGTVPGAIPGVPDFYFDDTEAVFGNGKFTTNRRYMRESAGSPNLKIATSTTMRLIGNGFFEWEHDGYRAYHVFSTGQLNGFTSTFEAFDL